MSWRLWQPCSLAKLQCRACLSSLQPCSPIPPFMFATDDQAVVMLDMHNIVDAIHVSAGATLEFVNITVSPVCAALARKDWCQMCRELRSTAHPHGIAVSMKLFC